MVLRTWRSSLTFLTFPATKSNRRVRNFSRCSLSIFSISAKGLVFNSCTSLSFMLAGYYSGFERQLITRQTQGLLRFHGARGVHLENNPSGPDNVDIMVHRTLSTAHSGFGWTLGNRLVRENSYPKATLAFHKVGNGAAGGFDLGGIKAGGFERLQTIMAVAQIQAAGFNLTLLVAPLVPLPVFYLLWDKHINLNGI